jgi:hypothetical protein
MITINVSLFLHAICFSATFLTLVLGLSIRKFDPIPRCSVKHILSKLWLNLDFWSSPANVIA